MVAAAGVRQRAWHVRALLSCAALAAAVALAPASAASGLIPDPDPNPDPAQPQPDAYQSAPATATSGAAPQTPAPAPVLPTVHISTPPTPLRSAPPKVHLRPTVVATPTHVTEVPSESPTPRSTASPAEPHIVVPATVDSRPSKAKRPRPAHATPRARREVAHHARATAPRSTIVFARSALLLRWPAAFAPSVEIAQPRQMSRGVALAVAAVVLLSGSFLAVAARQVRQQVGP